MSQSISTATTNTSTTAGKSAAKMPEFVRLSDANSPEIYARAEAYRQYFKSNQDAQTAHNFIICMDDIHPNGVAWLVKSLAFDGSMTGKALEMGVRLAWIHADHGSVSITLKDWARLYTMAYGPVTADA
ncbi:hypothetical protein [Arthrobacter sp. SDTb3-6]|uniref:hypothetical protein n=1 Tax=Arthrobacter sp. SDTb3-6 TaxID=2713571 RepID=UPI00159E5EF4|nr:hypothetical protein [Arthrobacter sp. SDTb3-6]NVM97675.1 hypothetical protein [Arthrobacter sp. SDTb3-6]